MLLGQEQDAFSRALPRWWTQFRPDSNRRQTSSLRGGRWHKSQAARPRLLKNPMRRVHQENVISLPQTQVNSTRQMKCLLLVRHLRQEPCRIRTLWLLPHARCRAIMPRNRVGRSAMPTGPLTGRQFAGACRCHRCLPVNAGSGACHLSSGERRSNGGFS